MPSGQVIRLVNEGDTLFRDMYGNIPYSIAPHEQIFIDWDAMCLWMGHPEANDLDPRNRVRVAEYARLKGRYGIDAQNLDMTLKGISVDADELFQSMRPKLAAYDASSNTRIMTVADDPAGDSLTPTLETTNGDNQSLILARMQQMEQEMSNLRAQLAANARTEQALNDAQPISTDNPDLDNGAVRIGSQPAQIEGTIPTSEPEPERIAPRPTPRTTPGEDTPTRVRVSQQG